MSINIGPPMVDELKPKIAVIGVGGAGGNAVANMISSKVEGVDFVVANTDAQALNASPADYRIQLGPEITQGLGAGSRPEVGRAAAGIPEDAPIESKMVSNAIRSAQTQVEAQNFEMRKNVLKYDDVMNRQRQVVYGERRMVLEGEDIKDQIATFVRDTLTAYVTSATSEGYGEDWDLDLLWMLVRIHLNMDRHMLLCHEFGH